MTDEIIMIGRGRKGKSTLAREVLESTMDPDKEDWKANDLNVAFHNDCECGKKNVPIYIFNQYYFSEDLIFVCKECLPTVPVKRAAWKKKYVK